MPCPPQEKAAFFLKIPRFLKNFYDFFLFLFEKHAIIAAKWLLPLRFHALFLLFFGKNRKKPRIIPFRMASWYNQ